MQPQIRYFSYVLGARRRTGLEPVAAAAAAAATTTTTTRRPSQSTGKLRALKGGARLGSAAFRVALVATLISVAAAATAKPRKHTPPSVADDVIEGRLEAPLSKQKFSESEMRSQVKKVCQNKVVQIKSRSHMRALLYAQFLNQDLCKLRYRPAFNELDPILRVEPKEVCSAKSIELIKDYHFRFIRPHRDVNRMPSQFEPMPTEVVKGQLYSHPDTYLVRFDEWDNAIMMPIALRHFFLAYSLQVSHLCKRLLVKNLNIDSKTVLNDDDNALMLMFDEQTPIGALLAHILEHLNFDNVVHIDELDGERQMGTHDSQFHLQKNQALYLKTSASENSALIEMIEGCKLRFKPLYDKLLMPIIRLSKLGYEYCGPKLSAEERNQLNGTEVRTWLSVVHVCELFDKVHLVRDDGPNSGGEPALSSSSDKMLKDAAQAREDEGTLRPMSEKEVLSSAQKREFEFGAPIEYELSYKIPLGDEIWIKGTKQLDLELSRKPGNSDPFGFFGIVRRLAAAAKAALASLDLERFAHYRKHSLWYNGVLNFISSITNVMSITATVTTLVASPAGR